jgi:hypothetical protein
MQLEHHIIFWLVVVICMRRKKRGTEKAVIGEGGLIAIRVTRVD